MKRDKVKCHHKYVHVTDIAFTLNLYCKCGKNPFIFTEGDKHLKLHFFTSLQIEHKCFIQT